MSGGELLRDRAGPLTCATPCLCDDRFRNEIEALRQLSELSTLLVSAEDRLHPLDDRDDIRVGIGLPAGPLFLIADGFKAQAQLMEQCSTGPGDSRRDDGLQGRHVVVTEISQARGDPFGWNRAVSNRPRHQALLNVPIPLLLFNTRTGFFDSLAYFTEVPARSADLLQIQGEDLQCAKLAKMGNKQPKSIGTLVIPDEIEVRFQATKIRAKTVKGFGRGISGDEPCGRPSGGCMVPVCRVDDPAMLHVVSSCHRTTAFNRRSSPHLCVRQSVC